MAICRFPNASLEIACRAQTEEDCTFEIKIGISSSTFSLNIGWQDPYESNVTVASNSSEVQIRKID